MRRRDISTLATDIFGGSDPRANTEIAARVTGNFTGTTDMILQWAACKWGIDEDIVRGAGGHRILVAPVGPG